MFEPKLESNLNLTSPLFFQEEPINEIVFETINKCAMLFNI